MTIITTSSKCLCFGWWWVAVQVIWLKKMAIIHCKKQCKAPKQWSQWWLQSNQSWHSGMSWRKQRITSWFHMGNNKEYRNAQICSSIAYIRRVPHHHHHQKWLNFSMQDALPPATVRAFCSSSSEILFPFSIGGVGVFSLMPLIYCMKYYVPYAETSWCYWWQPNAMII